MKKFWSNALLEKLSVEEMIQKSNSRMIYDKKINSVVSLNPHLQQEIDSLPQNSILKGIPILIKDCFKTKNWATTAGDKKYSNYIPTVC
jgi:Asp-tRNA(Asn)/Glu-tRNA(Gln) amidotransferase A subunit family amidase